MGTNHTELNQLDIVQQNTGATSGVHPSREGAVESELHEHHQQLAASVALHEQRAELFEQLAANERDQAARDLVALQAVARFLGKPELINTPERLKGEAIVSAALEVLAAHQALGEPIHYKALYQMVCNAGYTVGGKDPLSTFLASISRSDKIVSKGKRTGIYVAKQDTL